MSFIPSTAVTTREPKQISLSLMQFTVALICVVALLVIVGLAYFVKPPGDNQRVIDMVTGGLLTVGFANIIGFLFGQKEAVEQVRKATAAGAAQATDAAAAQAAALPAATEAKTAIVNADTATVNEGGSDGPN